MEPHVFTHERCDQKVTFFSCWLTAGREFEAKFDTLREAVTAAKGGTNPIRLTLRNGQRVRTVELAYHDGLRYPRLERIEGTRDRIGDILTARRR